MNIFLKFLDLPPDTPMLDLSKIASMDLSKLPVVEQSGEGCIQNIQEWLLHEVSSSETAILPEDKLQRILVGVCKLPFLTLLSYCKLEFVNFYCILNHELEFIILKLLFNSFQACNQLEIATYVEERSIRMCCDALQTLKAGTAGTATTKLLDVLEAAFGVVEAEDEVPDIQPTPVKAEEVLPSSAFVPKAADTLGQPGTSGIKCKAKTDISGASKHKSAKPSKSGPVALADATPFYPTTKEKATYLHIGGDPHYIGQHKGSQFTKLVVYQCFYARRCRERGENPEECDVLTQNKAQMSTHIHKFHLGVCLACYICPE